MIGNKMLDAINEQIHRELYSEYLYLAMAAWFHAEGLEGFGHFFEKQAQEEHDHAMKFYHYLFERGGRAVLPAIEKPPCDFSGVLELFEQALGHERSITKSIYDLMELAGAEKDHASMSFLTWYINEQVEEEASVERILSKLSMIKGNPQGILMMDEHLATRS